MTTATKTEVFTVCFPVNVTYEVAVEAPEGSDRQTVIEAITSAHLAEAEPADAYWDLKHYASYEDACVLNKDEQEID